MINSKSLSKQLENSIPKSRFPPIHFPSCTESPSVMTSFMVSHLLLPDKCDCEVVDEERDSIDILVLLALKLHHICKVNVGLPLSRQFIDEIWHGIHSIAPKWHHVVILERKRK